ncbi:ras-related protein Rab-9B isoform 2-T6 [Morphnus guianensis]
MSGKSLLLKVILLGDGGVGKSSLMNRYVTNKFDSQAFHTIGVEFLNRDLEVDGRFVTLQIWDTAGQERFKSLRTPFYRGADCCLLTFSVDDRQSFENLSNWQKEFVYYADVKDPEHFPFVVLGNKIDKLERQVSTEEAQAWCMENGSTPDLASHTLKPSMKNTYVDTHRVTSKGLELPGVQEIWTMKLQLVSVTSNHPVQASRFFFSLTLLDISFKIQDSVTCGSDLHL